ncbi:hypothetical protein Bca4012_010106 [Brassica carinata]
MDKLKPLEIITLIQTARMEIFKGLRDTKINILNWFYWYVIPESALFRVLTVSLSSQGKQPVWCKDSRGDKQTNAGLGAAGHALRTAWIVFKIRKALPKSL